MAAACLSVDFRSLGLQRLAELRRSARLESGEGPQEPVLPEVSQEAPPASSPPSPLPAEVGALPVTPCDLEPEDRVIRLEDVRGRKVVLREPPATLVELSSPEELPKYGVEGLRKLAKAEGVEVPRGANKESLVKALTGAFLSYQQHGAADCR